MAAAWFCTCLCLDLIEGGGVESTLHLELRLFGFRLSLPLWPLILAASCSLPGLDVLLVGRGASSLLVLFSGRLGGGGKIFFNH